MSMAICRQCGELKDTDYDLDGTWTDQYEWICTACTEHLIEQSTYPHERDSE